MFYFSPPLLGTRCCLRVQLRDRARTELTCRTLSQKCPKVAVPVPSKPIYYKVPLRRLGTALLGADNGDTLPSHFQTLFALHKLTSSRTITVVNRTFDSPSTLLGRRLTCILNRVHLRDTVPILAYVLRGRTRRPVIHRRTTRTLKTVNDIRDVPLLRHCLASPSRTIHRAYRVTLKLVHRPRRARRPVIRISKRLRFNDISPTPTLGADGAITRLRSRLVSLDLGLCRHCGTVFTLHGHKSRSTILTLYSNFTSSDTLFHRRVTCILNRLRRPTDVPTLTMRLQQASRTPVIHRRYTRTLKSVTARRYLTVLGRFRRSPRSIIQRDYLITHSVCRCRGGPSRLRFCPISWSLVGAF